MKRPWAAATLMWPNSSATWLTHTRPRQIRRSRGVLQARAGGLASRRSARTTPRWPQTLMTWPASLPPAAMPKTRSSMRARQQLPSSLMQPPRPPGAQRKEGIGRPRRPAHGLFCSSCRQSCGRGAEAAGACRRSSAGKRFVMAQWAKQSSAAAAVQQMGLRFAAGSDALAALVRERQDLSAFWRERDKALIEALSKPQGQRDPQRSTQSAEQIAETESKLAAIAARLEGAIPRICGTGEPKAAQDRGACRHCWRSTKRWYSGLPVRKETYVFALTREGFEWKTIPLGADGAGARRWRRSGAGSMWTRWPRIATDGMHAGGSGQARAVAHRMRPSCREGVRGGQHARPGACRLRAGEGRASCSILASRTSFTTRSSARSRG